MPPIIAPLLPASNNPCPPVGAEVIEALAMSVVVGVIVSTCVGCAVGISVGEAVGLMTIARGVG